MKHKVPTHFVLSLTAAALLLAMPACSLSQSSVGVSSLPLLPTAQSGAASARSDANSAPAVHATLPGEPPAGTESQIQDITSSAVAAQHRASGGENYAFNLFERPFDQSMNTYFPDLDIKHATLNRDKTWTYVTITLVGQDAKGGLPGDYGVELDVNRDGRGDFLILASAPTASWTSDGVRVWQDANHDIGGIHPVQADLPPQKGDGYEKLLFDQGQGSDPDMAFARISPKDPNSLQIAFKRTLFNDANPYLWGAWAIDPGIFHPDWFDYNDHFTQAEAGSPLVEMTQFYPLKALYTVDDTCRWAVGFNPTGDEPGVCPVPRTPTPPPPPPPPPMPTNTSIPVIP